MNYAVLLSMIFGVHMLAMFSPGPNVLIVTQTALNYTRRAGVYPVYANYRSRSHP